METPFTVELIDEIANMVRLSAGADNLDKELVYAVNSVTS
jgi:hypothetical protein